MNKISFLFGIVAILVSFFATLSWIFLFFTMASAIIALSTGIFSVVKKMERGRPPGMVGIILAGLAIVVSIFFVVLESATENFVFVECNPTMSSFSCSVKHTQGNDKVNACWVLKADCQNGRGFEAQSCQEVLPSGTATKIISAEEIVGFSECDVITSISIPQVTVEHAI